MIKTLAAVGNSLALIIERPILDLLHIDKNTPLEIQTDGHALIIQPVSKQRQMRIRRSAERMMRVHEKTLQKLAK